MIRKRIFGRLGLGAILASTVLAGVLVLGGASVASAQQAPVLKVVPSSISGSSCTAGCTVTVKWKHAGRANAGAIVIVECNFNVYTGDADACNQNADNLDQPGGPWLPTDNKTNGSDSVQLESGTVGDGTCNADQVCAVILANLDTMEPIAGPSAFSVTP